MTNLYEFLGEIFRRASVDSNPIKSITVSEQELEWLKNYLAQPEFELHFKARQIPDTPTQENAFAMDFSIAGSADEIFNLVTEAMYQNPTFASIVLAANQFHKVHMLKCERCQHAFLNLNPTETNWQFSPHK